MGGRKRAMRSSSRRRAKWRMGLSDEVVQRVRKCGGVRRWRESLVSVARGGSEEEIITAMNLGLQLFKCSRGKLGLKVETFQL